MRFTPWPKTPRLFRDCTVTEKIDGTNGAIRVDLYDDHAPEIDAAIDAGNFAFVELPNSPTYVVAAQSRNRIIWPGADNYGFAAWAHARAAELVATLGPGIHFGEWWGHGIQRGYGLPRGERRFSLFNTARYSRQSLDAVPGLDVVPVLYEGVFDTAVVRGLLADLGNDGSVAAPGYRRPEGVCVYHTASGGVFKALIENDDRPKGEH